MVSCVLAVGVKQREVPGGGKSNREESGLSSSAVGGLLREGNLLTATVAAVVFSCRHREFAADHTLRSLVSDAARIQYRTFFVWRSVDRALGSLVSNAVRMRYSTSFGALAIA